MSNVNELDNKVLMTLDDIILSLDKEEANVKLEFEQKLKTIAANRDAVANCITNYKDNIKNGMVNIQSISIETIESLYHGYPIEGNLPEKFHFLEDGELKLWKMSDMEVSIRRIEGPLKSERTLQHIITLKKKFLEDRSLIQVQFNNTKQFTFYTTRRDWLEVTEADGKQIFAIKPEYMPDPAKIRTLSEAEKKIIDVKGY